MKDSCVSRSSDSERNGELTLKPRLSFLRKRTATFLGKIKVRFFKYIDIVNILSLFPVFL